jgi:hypothetical protein
MLLKFLLLAIYQAHTFFLNSGYWLHIAAISRVKASSRAVSATGARLTTLLWSLRFVTVTAGAGLTFAFGFDGAESLASTLAASEFAFSWRYAAAAFGVSLTI